MSLEEDLGMDRREHARAPFLVLEVKGEHSDKVFVATTKNISPGGLFLSSAESLKVGDRFPIEFVLPDNKTTFKCMSEVMWTKNYEEFGVASEGIGVRFVDLQASEKKILGDWIEAEEKRLEG